MYVTADFHGLVPTRGVVMLVLLAQTSPLIDMMRWVTSDSKDMLETTR